MLDNNVPNKVAIIGCGFRLPGDSNDTETLWNNLINKFNGIVNTSGRWSNNYSLNDEISANRAGLISLEDQIMKFDPLMFSISPNDSSNIDPQQRLLLKCVWESLEDAFIDPIKLRGSDTSVYIGVSTIDYQSNLRNPEESLKNIFGSTNHSASNRISYCFDFKGTSLSIDTACSSSSNAIVLGCQSIIDGKSNYSIVGGSNIILDETVSKGFTNLNMLSKSGECKSFDADADGYVRGEGVGVVVLKNLQNAINDGDRIYCVINGMNSNIDGCEVDKNNFYSPSKIGQYENIKSMFLNNIVKEFEIDYVECHGTGTPTGDPIEVEGISMVFSKYHSKENPLLIGSFKPNIGHLEAGSGIASLIKCCLMFKHRKFVPNINFNKPNPMIKFDEWNLKVVDQILPFPNNKKVSILVNNFGITGSNVCLLLSEYLNEENSINNLNYIQENEKYYLIPFSSNSNKSLNDYISIFQKDLISFSDKIKFFEFLQFHILSKTLKLYQRSVILAKKWSDIYNNENILKTNNSIISNLISTKQSNNDQNIVFVFSGQGTQWKGMGEKLYYNDYVFKDTIDLIDLKLFKYFGYSILEKLRSNNDNTINHPILAQPSICMIQIGLFESLTKQWGIKPSFLIGHSLGELTAQYCSGTINIDTLCYVLYNRAKSQNKTIGSGKMLSINISPNEYLEKYSKDYPSIEISCHNSPNSIVIGGDENLLKEINLKIKSNGIFTSFLSTPSSFHTSSQDQIKEELIQLNFETVCPNINILSTVERDFFNNDTIKFNPDYVFRNIREPVYFSQTIQKLYKHIEENKLGQKIIFIEISPHSALTYYLKQLQPQLNYINNIVTFSTLDKKKDDINQMFNLISNLYCNHNYPINFENQLNKKEITYCLSFKFKNLYMPKYQWDDKVYWKEDLKQLKKRKNGSTIDILGNRNLNSPFLSFTTIIDIEKKQFQYFKGHQVDKLYYFPGCGYIENIINSFPNSCININYLEFKTPLILSENEKKNLQTNFIQLSKKDYRAQFNFLNNSKWIQTSSGNFQLFNYENINDKKIDIQYLLSICNLTKLNSDEFYSYVKNKTGLYYSGLFRNIKETYIGNNCCLNLVKYNKIENIESIISCTTLDSCLHSSLILIQNNCKIVFDKVENFKFYSSNLPKDYNSDLYSFSKLTNIKGNSFEYYIKIMLQDGTVIFEIENAVMKSMSEIKDSLTLQYPENELSTTYLQSKDCEINLNFRFSNLDKFKFNFNNFPENILYNFISQKFYYFIQENYSNFLTIQDINENSLKDLEIFLIDKKNSKLFYFVFSIIKDYYNEDFNVLEWNENNFPYFNILSKCSKIIIDILFPYKDEDKLEKPQSLYGSEILNQFNLNPINYLNIKLLSKIIKNSLKPVLMKKNVIRIIEFYGNDGLVSNEILKSISKLLEKKSKNGSILIDIEYTFSDKSLNSLNQIKNRLEVFDKYGSLLYKNINLNEELINKQNLLPSYYDIVLLSNLNQVNDISKSLIQIYKILKNEGHLIFLEPCYNSIVFKTLYGAFDRWSTIEDNEIRNENYTLTKDEWSKILIKNNFKNINFSTNENISTILIHSQKQLINNSTQAIEEFYIYKNLEDNMNLSIFNSKIYKTISSISEFENNINQFYKGKIYFLKSLENLNLNNYIEITLEYIQIVQFLFKNNLNSPKLILITKNCYGKESENYLSSSLIGSFKYFLEQLEILSLYSFDFDDESFNNENSIKLIEQVIDEKENIEREFIIRNNKIYLEKVKIESNLFSTFKSKNLENNYENLYSRLNSNLEFQLESKQKKLNHDEIEIEIKSIGLNYKDFLFYSGSIQSSNGKPIFGLEYSGIIKSIGKNVDNFKIGDKVFSIGINTSSSSIVVNKNHTCNIPNNISFSEASSIPVVYLTSYYSIFKIGNLNIKRKESILIHSATGGVGLSSIEILKWKNFNGFLFVTVGSKEKEEYLKKRYGSFINGIYSTRNKEYVNQIKNKLKEMGSKKNGVDLILNTLSGDYIESNFQCLNTGGRIVDLSITHLSPNDYIDYGKFKYNYGYHNIELMNIDFDYLTTILKKIGNAISNNDLSLIPIKEFSVNNIKDAFEYINKRQHIGKIVIKYDLDITKKLINKEDESPIFKSNYKITNNIGKNIIITGQSGIALETIKWISKHSKSIKNIIILSKSKLKWELELLINTFKNQINSQIKFYYKSIDIENYNQIENSINEILNENKEITNIDSILHFAFQYTTSELLDIDFNHLRESHGAKTIGAINLHNISLNYNWKIKNFICCSSVVTLFGNFNQCGYISSNSVIDSFIKYRKSLNLPALSINFGGIGSIGLLTKKEGIEKFLEQTGIEIMPSNIVLGSLDLFIQNNQLIQNNFGNLIVNKLNLETLTSSLLYNHKIDYIRNKYENEKGINNIYINNNIDFKKIQIQKIYSKLSELLFINNDNININLKLSEYGADSLFLIQFKNFVDIEFKKNIITIQELQNQSISLIISKITEK